MLDFYVFFCYNIKVKTRVKFNEISKEELYELYLKQVEKCEELESKIFKQQLELAEKTKKL